jgi:hypothetical protein
MALSVTELRSFPDPQFTFDYRVDLPGLRENYVEEIELPFRSFDEINVVRNGKKMKFAGVSDKPNLRVTCYEDYLGTTRNFFLQWQEEIQDSETGTFNTPAVYQKDITVYLLAPDQSVAATIEFLGCTLINFSGYTFNSQSERIRPTADITVNHIRVT